ncbi:MAG: MutT/NUDIX family protein [uncultured bacterium (gcode 4)]|uniref:MutT/NUDIX family protein n=1 Tax=uncultured bacterium (gcode 4) TaxID=1234023 RepID=K1YMP6_9BACT|nr:MAG: MutT/NUDIX family protein [uncultured bacterium (gcode 4)]
MKWDFPGGTVDFWETLEETLKREIMEETGLNITVNEMIPRCYSNVWIHEDFKIHAMVFCYRCKLIGGEISLNDHKIHDLKWIDKNDFCNYEFLPSIKLFLDEVNFLDEE